MRKRIGSGAPTVPQQSDEQQIVLTCQVLADMGFGATRKLLETVVADYIRKNGIQTPFVNGIPGKDWWQRFMIMLPATS